MLQQFRFSRFFNLVVLFFAVSITAFAQTEPDTVRRKPALPTGPPPVQQPQQPQPRVIKRPPVQEQPQVVEQGDKDEKEKLPFRERVYWGGGLGLQFGSYTSITLLPHLGYRATEKLWTGAGLTYQYQSGDGVSLQNVGGKVFAQQEVFKNFLIHGEYEVLSVEYLNIFTNGYYEKAREMMSLPMAGLGYRQYISNRVSSDILVLYNFNDEFPNPYSNPIIRINFNFPF